MLMGLLRDRLLAGVFVTTRADAFKTRCSLSLIVSSNVIGTVVCLHI